MPKLDITSNIFLGNELGWPAPGAWLQLPYRRRMEQRAAAILDQLDVQVVSLREPVGNLSSEQRQMIAIARALVRPARLVVLDEPTMPLSYAHQQSSSS